MLPERTLEDHINDDTDIVNLIQSIRNPIPKILFLSIERVEGNYTMSVLDKNYTFISNYLPLKLSSS